jgi:hypothetical protein
MKNRKRWAVALRRMANRLDPVPASPLIQQNLATGGTNWTLRIHEPVDVKRIDRSLGSHVRSRFRAAGMRG